MTGIFSDEEMQILWNNAGNENVLIILLLCYTGWSINEIVKIKRDSVDPDELTMRGGIFKERIVPIHWAIQREVFLSLYWYGAAKHSENYICGASGESLTPQELRGRLQRTMAVYSMHHNVSDIRKQFMHMCEESSMDKEVRDYFLGNGLYEPGIEILKNEINKLPYKGRVTGLLRKWKTYE